MATTNPIVTSLPAYVQQNRDLLIKNFGLVGGGTRARIGLQTGIKRKAALNYLEVDAKFQDGSDCEFSPTSTATFTQREIEVATIAVQMDYCPKKLLGKYPEYLVAVNAVAQGERMPFEQFLVDAMIKDINAKIETAIWQGDTDSQNGNLNKFDGFLKIASDEADVIDVAIAAGTSAYDGIEEVYLALPEEVLKLGGEIYVSPAIYRYFMAALVRKNYFHYSGAENANPTDFFFPGSNVRVVLTEGLAGVNVILGTHPKNLVYGTDMENDEEVFDIWYSKDDKVFKLDAEWNSGVQIAFPNRVVLGVFASAPTIGRNSTSDALEAIAQALTFTGSETEPTIADNVNLMATAGVNSIAGIENSAAALAAEDKVFKTQAQETPTGENGGIS